MKEDDFSQIDIHLDECNMLIMKAIDEKYKSTRLQLLAHASFEIYEIQKILEFSRSIHA